MGSTLKASSASLKTSDLAFVPASLEPGSGVYLVSSELCLASAWA